MLLLLLLWIFIYPHVSWYPKEGYFEEDFCYQAVVFLQGHPLGYVLVILLIGIALSILVRPRYLLVDAPNRVVVYSLPIVGRRSYYFAEIQGIQMEVDMSQVLLRLNSPKLYRLYLKLSRGKVVLISEGRSESAIFELGHKLRQIFNIQEMEHLHRIGRKKGLEIQLGNYVVEKELSHGGMGKVLLAKEKSSQKRVALKVLPASLALRKNYATNFAKETQVLQGLSHPGIVKVYAVGRDSEGGKDVYFYAMEYIEGKPLSHIIEEGGLDYKTSARIVKEVALALDYIHKHGVVHRDVKPSNIMVREDDSAVLIDFGIARVFPYQKSEIPKVKGPEISHYVGTPPYMSPEQLSSRQPIDYRTDIYSLGVTLYEMLTGRLPFKGAVLLIYRAILSSYPPDPTSIKPDIPKELEIITLRAMEKKLHKRYHSGAEFAEDLDRWLKGIPILSREVCWWIRCWRKFRGFFRWI